MAEHIEDRLRRGARAVREAQHPKIIHFGAAQTQITSGLAWVMVQPDDADRLADLAAAVRELEQCYGDRTLEIGPLKRVRAALAALAEEADRG